MFITHTHTHTHTHYTHITTLQHAAQPTPQVIQVDAHGGRSGGLAAVDRREPLERDASRTLPQHMSHNRSGIQYITADHSGAHCNPAGCQTLTPLWAPHGKENTSQV